MVNPNRDSVKLDPSDENEYTSSDHVKPVQAPKSARNFKNVYSNTGREGKNEEEKIAGKKKLGTKPSKEESPHLSTADGTSEVQPDKDEDENGSKNSLFSLFKQPTKEAIASSPSQLLGQKKTDSPAHLFSSLSQSKEGEADKDTVASGIALKKRLRDDEVNADINLSSLAHNAATTTLQVADNFNYSIEKTAAVHNDLQDLYTELVKQLYTVEKSGQTDTVLILDYPPLFKDAKVIVSSFDTAKGQLNIAFENLTQAAQKILDLDVNRKSLTDALNKQGYNVQLLTATTTITDNLNVDNPAQPQDKNQEDQQDTKQQKRRRNNEEDAQ